MTHKERLEKIKSQLALRENCNARRLYDFDALMDEGVLRTADQIELTLSSLEDLTKMGLNELKS